MAKGDQGTGVGPEAPSSSQPEWEMTVARSDLGERSRLAPLSGPKGCWQQEQDPFVKWDYFGSR